MKRSRRIALVFILAAVLLTTVVFTLTHHCPDAGFGFSEDRRELQRLKNRTTIPRPEDFDTSVTLEKMLQPGVDLDRWSQSRAARVEGYVISIANGPLELTNCYVPSNRDIHIHIGTRPDAPPREQLVLEVTPRMQDWAVQQGWDWSEANLRTLMLNRWCSFEGWLFYDSHHAGESETNAPGREGNWRATAWEIHPITNFEIRTRN